MKILYVPGYRFPASLDEPLTCGDLRYSFNLARALARAGTAVTVLTRGSTTDPRRQTWEGVDIVRYRPELRRLFATSFDVSPRRARDYRALAPGTDAIIANSPLSLELLMPTRRPLVYVCSGIEDVHNYGRSPRELLQRAGILALRDPARQLTWKRADRVNTTAALEDGILLRRGVPPDRITRIGPGVELSRYRPHAAHEVRAIRTRILGDEAQSRPIVLSVARFTPAKGILETIHAFARLRATHPLAYLLLVGVQHSHRSDYLAQVKRQIAQHGLERDVGIHENVPESVLPLYFSAADVTTVFSVGYDPLPTVMIESMSCGTPVVATDFATRHQVIRDGETGLLVPERDEGAWIASVGRVLTDTPFRERLAAAGLARVRAEFDMDRVARQYLDLIGAL